MTAVLLLAIAFLLMLCVTLTVLLIGRDRAATRDEAHLRSVADAECKEADRLHALLGQAEAKVRHLTERNQELRDELDLSQPCEASLTAEWLAFINRWPVLEDPR